MHKDLVDVFLPNKRMHIKAIEALNLHTVKCLLCDHAAEFLVNTARAPVCRAHLASGAQIFDLAPEGMPIYEFIGSESGSIFVIPIPDYYVTETHMHENLVSWTAIGNDSVLATGICDWDRLDEEVEFSVAHSLWQDRITKLGQANRISEWNDYLRSARQA